MLQKYFIAIVPPEPLLSQIKNIKESIFEKYQVKGALRSPAHITLHMPFSWEEEKEKKLVDCLQSFDYENKIAIDLQNFSCFEPRVIFINVKQEKTLLQLQKKLVQHVKVNLLLFNQSDDMRGFHPHITIAFRDLKKPVFYKLWEEFENKVFQEKFTCESICLLKHVNDRWEVLKEFKFTT